MKDISLSLFLDTILGEGATTLDILKTDEVHIQVMMGLNGRRVQILCNFEDIPAATVWGYLNQLGMVDLMPFFIQPE